MKQLCVSLDPETMADIDAAAEALGQTRSEFVRERLEWALLNLKEGKA
jgi:predicted DNA-binding protein